MARPRTVNALKRVTVRLPATLVTRLEQEACTSERTVSDVVRAHLSADPQLQLDRAPARRRRPAAASGADPALLRQLASIGGNVNQIARTLNSHVASGQPIDVVRSLATLTLVEQHLYALAIAESSRYRQAEQGAV